MLKNYKRQGLSIIDSNQNSSIITLFSRNFYMEQLFEDNILNIFVGGNVAGQQKWLYPRMLFASDDMVL